MQRKLNEGIVVIFFLSYIREVENAAKKGHTAEALYGITTLSAVSRSTINNIRTKKAIHVWAGKYKNVSTAENRYA